MHLLEAAIQGVRGFSPSLRFTLKTGYTVLHPSAAESAPLGTLVAAVLCADGRGEDAGLSAQAERPGRVALAFAGNDGSLYRLMRELGGKASLQRMNRTAQTPETVAQDPQGILEGLRGAAGVPGRATFEALWVLSGSRWPSVRAKQKARPAPGGTTTSGLQAAVLVTAATDVRAARARLAELEGELALSREVAQVQFEADGVESELYQLTTQSDASERPRQALAQAEAALAKAPTPTSLGLPEDIVARAERFPALLRRRDEQLARLAAERERVEEAPDTSADVEPLTRDRAFLASVVGGLLLPVLGAVLDGGLRYLALLGIPVFGVAAIRALRFVEALQQSQQGVRKGGMTAARERKILDEFEAEAAPVVKAMALLRVETPSELVAALSEHPALRAEVQRQREALALAERDPTQQAGKARQDALRAQLARLNAELEQKGSYVRDVREVERDVARVRESIALAQSGAAGTGDAPGAPSGPLEDPCPGLLGSAAELLQTDLAATAGLVRDRLQQYFAALTDKRYGPVELAPTGKATVQAGAQRVPATSLPPKDLDLLYLALRLTLVEKLAAKVKLPLVVEDPLGSLDEAKFGLVSRMLKHLGTLTQVVQVTRHPAFVSDSTATL
ncbi:MAG: chromosome segregation protein SMC [Myxococcaceae bacterium]|nr:chromosome segregation protein SMC [Myxococcaceae bacterium]MCI0670700.1 chromosome segregation protein SMC [Myxococcaceae bacterium]